MAITVQSPYAFASDLVTITEAVALFAECGKEREVDAKTLRRWVAKHRVPTEKAGKDLLASWTDLLKVHAAETDRRQGITRR
jgi:hypothetical protein